MIRDLLPLLAGLAVAAIVYTTRELRRKRHRINPALPDLTMEEAWAIWTQSAETKPDSVFAMALAEQGVLTPPVESEALKGLLDGEKLYQEADHPRLALRSAILDNAAIAMHLDAISGFGEAERAALLRGYAEGMDAALQEARKICTLKWIVLRQYARLKYDDAVAGDWFHHFMRIARPYILEKTRLTREHVLQMDEGSRRFVEIYDALLNDLRVEMLKARPKKRFVEPDLA